jgi:hypothetical protein
VTSAVVALVAVVAFPFKEPLNVVAFIVPADSSPSLLPLIVLTVTPLVENRLIVSSVVILIVLIAFISTEGPEERLILLPEVKLILSAFNGKDPVANIPVLLKYNPLGEVTSR